MLKATKKVYMSILAILLVFITVVATTFAWVGILTYAQTDTFKMNLKVQDLENDYFLSISATDEEGYDDEGHFYTTYSDTANVTELKKQIIKNMGISIADLTNDNLVDRKFNQVYQIAPATTTRNTILNDEFHCLESRWGAKSIQTANSKAYYKFDIYISMEHREGDSAINENTNQKMNLFLADIAQTLTGDISTQVVQNEFTYDPSNLYNPNGLYSVNDVVNIDAASAARLALAVYDPILRTDKYSGTETPNRLYIYQGGTQYPTYYSESDTYSFGGILPEEYNLAYYEHVMNKTIKPSEFPIPDEAINRGDLELIENNKDLFDDEYGFGISNGKKTKVKITVYFWFEGWDSDCFEIIDAVNVRININFGTDSNVAQ